MPSGKPGKLRQRGINEARAEPASSSVHVSRNRARYSAATRPPGPPPIIMQSCKGLPKLSGCCNEKSTNVLRQRLRPVFTYGRAMAPKCGSARATFVRIRVTCHRFGNLEWQLRATRKCSVIQHQQDDRADHGHEHTVNVQAGDARITQSCEKPAACEGAHDPEKDIQKETFAASIDDLAG